jgi:hypothetical protein
MVLLVQAYLLLNSNHLKARTIYTVLMNTLFSPWIAIVFPVTCGLEGYLEVHMFWVEHFLSALLNPLILSLSHRYYSKNTISFKNHIFAHVIFGFYQRMVLFPISQISYANLNFTLCPSKKDPFEPFIDKWYYLLSDAYIILGGEIFHRVVKIILEICKKIEKLIFHNDKYDGNKINKSY